MNDFYKAMKILQENKIIRESNEDDEYVVAIVKNGKRVVGLPIINIRHNFVEDSKSDIKYSTKEIAENSLEVIKKLTGLKNIRTYCRKDFYDEMYKKYENDKQKREYATYKDENNEISNSYFIASDDCIEKSTIGEQSYGTGSNSTSGRSSIDVYGTVAMIGLYFNEYKKEDIIGRAIKSKNKEELEKDLKIILKAIDIEFWGPYQPEVININELNLKSKVKKVGLTEKQSEKYEYSHELIICDKNNNDLKTAYVGSNYDSDIEEYEGWDSILEFAEGNNRADKIYIYDNGNLETVVWTRKFGTSERFDSLEEANEAE